MINLKSYLNQFFEIISKRRVAFLVIAGDVCHRARLDAEDLDVLMHLVDLIMSYKIKTYIIWGNHDVDGRKNIIGFFRKSFFEYILFSERKSFTRRFPIHYPPSPPIHVRVDGVSYCDTKTFLKTAKDLEENHDPAEDYRIFLGHVGVKGTLQGSTKSIRGVKPADIQRLSDSYDVILLGHHHITQEILPDNKAFYIGSVHQTRADEENHVPGGYIITLHDKEVDKTHIPNNLSPKFKTLYDYSTKSVLNNIIKPMLDLSKPREENEEYLQKLASMNPYYLIMPRLERRIKPKRAITISAKEEKTKVLRRVTKSMVSDKARAIEIGNHVVERFEKVEGGQL